MTYPTLSLNPSLTLPVEQLHNVLDNEQGVGRPLRRIVDDRTILKYRLKFENVLCGEIDQLLDVFEAPFKVNTPDHGLIDVVFLEDSMNVITTSPTLSTVIITVEQVLFTD
mgnify:CR=1 FL=1